MPKNTSNLVRQQREARGLSQVALAERVSLSRQSIGAIEAGRAIPAVDVALRIARALDCQVEELFGATPEQEHIDTEPASPGMAGRVALAHLAGRWVSYPLAGDGLRVSADGVVTRAQRGKVVVERMRPTSEARENVVLMGCATGLGLLADRLSARPGTGRFLWFARSSTEALASLSRNRAHVAGVHLVDTRTGEANIADVRRAACAQPVVLLTLARWEAGLVTAPGNPKSIRGAADLGQRGLRIVVREAGAGAQRLLERELGAAGLSRAVVQGARIRAPGHIEVARAVAMGAADTGVATRDAAMAFGLGFVPLAEERYDLVLPVAALTDARIARLLDVMTGAAFRRELALLGYDVRPTGERVAEVTAA